MLSTPLCGSAVSLRDTLPRAQFLSGGDVLAQSCSSAWRACRPGDVYFAVTTADDDGHEHVQAAITRGAVAVVAERLLPVTVPQILVRDSRVALARVCQALAGHPSRELTTIGITGSAGKTTTAMLVASIFEAAGQRAGVMSSLGNSDSVVQSAATSGSPAATEFAAWLARMNTAACDAAVIELSSQTLAQRSASGVALAAAILTNLQNEHQELHHSSRAYLNIKRRIFKLLRPGGLAIVNADDHRCRNLLANHQGPALTYGLHGEAQITASVLERSPSEQMFLLSAGDESIPVRTRMIGDHHVSNCLAAAAVGLAQGIDLATIARGLEAVDRLPGRLERLECGQPFGVYVDAASSAEALALAVKTVSQVTRGRVIAVWGPRAGSDAARRALAGRVLERGAHVVVLTNDEPGPSQPLAAIHDLLDGFDRPQRAEVIPNRATAIRYALGAARPGDAVLIAGRGDRVTRPLRGDGPGYDDRELACEWLFNRDEQQAARPRLRVVG